MKGSVELAPLTGLVDGIVDLTATGKTLAENHLDEREEIATCTARLIANPVAHKLKAAEIDAHRARGCGAMRIVGATRCGRIRARGTRADVEADVRAIIDEVRAGGDDAVLELTERFDHAELGAGAAARRRRTSSRRRVGVLEPDVLRRPAHRDRERARRSRRRRCVTSR